MCFFFNDTATTEIYTLSLHDALPIYRRLSDAGVPHTLEVLDRAGSAFALEPRFPFWDLRLVEFCLDRKSTRLNSSHGYISYAVFCLKKKKINTKTVNFLSYLAAFCLF